MINNHASKLVEHDAELAMGSRLENIYQPKDPHTGLDLVFWTETNGKRRPIESHEQEVVLRTNSGKARPVKQKTVILNDRFGQYMGLMIIFSVSPKNKNTATTTPELGNDTEPLEPSSLKPAPILVMDDDPLIRKTCTLMFGAVGLETMCAADGQEAVDLYKEMYNSENPIKVVIMDLTVPGAMGGVEATEKILEMDPSANIVVASGYSNDPVLANYQDYGFIARVEKPFAVQELTQTVKNILKN